MRYSITPYVGVDKVRFGMSPSEVAAQWGPPKHVQTTKLGNVKETREGDVFCIYNADRLVEVLFGRKASVLYKEVDLLHDPRALRVLLEDDPVPFEEYGMLNFFELGIGVTGVHDNDRDELSVGAFARGLWDPYRSTMRPWKHKGDKSN